MSARRVPLLSFVIPTHNRAADLRVTLGMLGSLGFDHQTAEVVVVDNASEEPVEPECALPTTLVRSSTNLGAAGRNLGAEAARGGWIVMLDDDSSPLGASGLLDAVSDAPSDVAAVMADIHLSGGRGRERGGLPEVFIGCGVAIRRDAFVRTGGYDPSFHYYAEEYDLAARLIMRGWRTAFDPRFIVEHRKVASGRRMDLILGRLVRNNGWVMQRYAPDAVRRLVLREERGRYRAIAAKESATHGFGAGLRELRRSIRGQHRTPMSEPQFDRFTGMTHARTALSGAIRPGQRVAIVDRGKNAGLIERALCELGAVVVESSKSADAVVPGSMSPGPMIDSAMAWQQR
ncbi:MAG: glycosyltransferase, partial [Salinibacterium sp.]|nr:glycosyltransferase [Salinibacterium sp.]